MSNIEHLGPSHLVLLHRVSRIVSSGVTLDRMLEELIAIAVEVTGCDACLVYLPDTSSGDMVLRASQLPHRGDIGHLRLKLGEGVTGWVAKYKTAVALTRHARCDERFRVFPTLVEDTWEALLSVPLITGGNVIGVMNVHHRDEHRHSPDEIATLSFVGEQLGNALALSRMAEDNARLKQRASQLQQRLDDRKFVERAKGVLQERYGLEERQAYSQMRKESRRSRRPMREVAESILLVEASERGLDVVAAGTAEAAGGMGVDSE